MAEKLNTPTLTYDVDQYALAEKISRRRGDFAHNLSDVALGDTTTVVLSAFTGGILDAAPVNTEVREQEAAEQAEATRRTLGGNALSSMMSKSPSVNEAIDYHKSAYELAA